MNEKWNKKYAQSPLPLFGNKPSFICQQSLAIDTQALSPCLFIGDGEGRNSRYMATSDIKVTAIDFSDQGQAWEDLIELREDIIGLSD